MTKRQCLTCGYFQAAPSDGVGWCNHPRRKNTSDIKLYVRGGELPCRNDWAHDLWEDKTTFAGSVDFALDNSTGPLAPASLDDIVFLTTNRQTSSDNSPADAAHGSAVDRVIREESTLRSSSVPTAGSNRALSRLAHRHMLAEKRVERFADGVAPAFDGGFSMPVEPKSPNAPVEDRVYEADRTDRSGGQYTATRPVFSPVPPVQPSEMDRSLRKMAIYPGEEDRFSSVPRPVDGTALPTIPRRDGVDSVIRSSFTEDDASAENTQSDAAQELDFDETGMVFEPRPTVDRRPYQREWPSNEEATGGLSVADESIVQPIDDVPGAEDDYPPAPRRHRQRGGGLFRSRRKPVVEPLDDNDGIWDDIPEVAAVDGAVDIQAPVQVPVERIPAPQFEVPPVVETYDGYAAFAEPLQTALWTDVTRACRTCREFRPAESGDRGWCTNKWAFNHRRMVDADERPCDSSVGCWWLPHDDIWLAGSDISAHGQPTPLLDLWLGQRHGRDLEQESGPIRRRQRG